jgi:hypothetical protein
LKKFKVEGEAESDLIDESMVNVDQLFEAVAASELELLRPDLDDEEFEQVGD